MVNDFKLWWSNAGSAMQPLPNEDIEEFARRVCELAWRGGEYSERHACAKDASDKIKYRIKQGFPEHGHADAVKRVILGRGDQHAATEDEK